jgi:hypothetical protein
MSGLLLFLLSPARSDGKRARLLMREGAGFDLALRLREPEGAPLGEVFTFLSGLYFRGKLAYARAYGAPPAGLPPALVITPTRGLLAPETRVDASVLREFAEAGDVAGDHPRFVRPLEADTVALARRAGRGTRYVLLGSVASDRYVGVLVSLLGERLLFPADFVGRGELSRGGLMLRAATDGPELEYVAVAGATRSGPRPPRLEPRPGARRPP